MQLLPIVNGLFLIIILLALHTFVLSHMRFPLRNIARLSGETMKMMFAATPFINWVAVSYGLLKCASFVLPSYRIAFPIIPFSY